MCRPGAGRPLATAECMDLRAAEATVAVENDKQFIKSPKAVRMSLLNRVVYFSAKNCVRPSIGRVPAVRCACGWLSRKDCKQIEWQHFVYFRVQRW